MTPEKDKNRGAGGAAVALEEDDAGRMSAEDGTREEDRPAEPEASRMTAQDSGGEQAAAEEASPAGDGPGASVKKAEFQEVSATPAKDKAANLDLLLDVVVPVSVELGRTSLTVKDILCTCQGSVIELDRAAGEPVDILVSGKPLARGEVVVVKERFGVRITELIGSIEGMAKA
jgi:flagellar motor switch protein FliN/FliY